MAKRKQYSATFKSRVAMEALSGDQTVSELASKYGVHPNQISTRKRQAKEGIVESFSGRKKHDGQAKEVQIRDLHAEIGQLTGENDFLASAFAKI